MREAVIVSTARTPIGKAYRGGFNNLASPTLAGHAISAAVQRAGIEPDRIEDCIMGAALTQGSQGGTHDACLLYTSPSPRDGLLSRMPSSA